MAAITMPMIRDVKMTSAWKLVDGNGVEEGSVVGAWVGDGKVVGEGDGEGWLVGAMVGVWTGTVEVGIGDGVGWVV